MTVQVWVHILEKDVRNDCILRCMLKEFTGFADGMLENIPVKMYYIFNTIYHILHVMLASNVPPKPPLVIGWAF